MTSNDFDECVASGQTCNYFPEGPKGEMQCRYCGKPKNTDTDARLLNEFLNGDRAGIATDVIRREFDRLNAIILSQSGMVPFSDHKALMEAFDQATATEIHQVRVGNSWVDSNPAEYAVVTNEKRIVYAAILQAATRDPMQEETVIPTWRERLSMLDKPTDFAIAMAAKMESTELRRELARIKAATRDAPSADAVILLARKSLYYLEGNLPDGPQDQLDFEQHKQVLKAIAASEPKGDGND